MTFVNEYVDSKYRTIDHENNIVLYRSGHSGGSSEILDNFELHLEEQIVYFTDRPNFSLVDGKETIHHEIIFLKIPAAFENRQAEIKGYISEAMDVFGSYWIREPEDIIIVSFPPTVKIG